VNNAHLGDDAELYALGVLDAAERAAAEEHLAACDDCRARVVAAESVVAALASTLPAYEPAAQNPFAPKRVVPLRPRVRFSFAAPRWATALAAALVLGVGFLGWQDVSLNQQRTSSDTALTAIVHGHFDHVTLTKARPSSPSAKVLYARDHSWLYALVDRPARGTHLIAEDATGARRDLGAFDARGAVATLFVRDPGPVSAVEIRDDAGVEGSAALRSSSR
jgi:anti-sigma factor RsiW